MNLEGAGNMDNFQLHHTGLHPKKVYRNMPVPLLYELALAHEFGAVLENVMVKPESRQVHYASAALTENTRASYPINYIDNARIPCKGPHPRNVVLLCCDAFGVLPPVSKLTLEQAMYHFISGYTSKVAGTEMGITEPEATFSACYGGAFLMWHPMKYAAMLAERMERHGTRAWLVNTGWTGGSYGVGRRMSLRHTRAIIDAIHSGELGRTETVTLPIFGLQVPVKCTGVPHDELQPHEAWGDDESYNSTLTHLARLFVNSFKQYLEDAHEHVGSDLAERILTGGPSLEELEGAEARYAPLSARAAPAGKRGAAAAAAAAAAKPAAKPAAVIAAAPAGAAAAEVN
ncbi:phosphoenolpyruvate carboxykinase [Raphidocelis subcapitata]|uniref:Phosphoenolpyruvate carboxykinase n=1 Tax=Raphidocelis subcapitata TaxID=307507 RepID=A0A2V0PNN9_9CHLO|nr:phosphoenolpyruvate carboxykinase [Raphidocelis subcapitata]|eukprot:GBF98755.1 phosphoenolpyruvate carboxykinase [Raphidocelis subcapitata]